MAEIVAALTGVMEAADYITDTAGGIADKALSKITWDGKAVAGTGPGWSTFVEHFGFNGSRYYGEFYFQNIGGVPQYVGITLKDGQKSTLLYEGWISGGQTTDPLEFTFSAKDSFFLVFASVLKPVYIDWPKVGPPAWRSNPDILTRATDMYWYALVQHNMVLCQAAAARFRNELSNYKSLMSDWNGKTGNTEDLYNQITVSVANLKAISQDVKRYYDIANEADKKLKSPLPMLELPTRINNVLSMMGVTVPGFVPSQPALNTDKLPDRTALATAQKATADNLNGVVEDIKAVLRDIDIKAKSLKLVSKEKYAEEVAKLNDWKINVKNELIDLLARYRELCKPLALNGIVPDPSTGKVDLAKADTGTKTGTAKAKAIATTIVNKAVVAVVMKTPAEEKIAPTPEELLKLTARRPGVAVVY